MRDKLRNLWFQINKTSHRMCCRSTKLTLCTLRRILTHLQKTVFETFGKRRTWSWWAIYPFAVMFSTPFNDYYFTHLQQWLFFPAAHLDTFWPSAADSFWNFWQKENLVMMSNFSICHTVFKYIYLLYLHLKLFFIYLTWCFQSHLL